MMIGASLIWLIQRSARHGVHSVVTVRADDQVLWIEAGTIVACVPDNQTLRNKPLKRLIANAISAPGFISNANARIAMGIEAQLPYPAAILVSDDIVENAALYGAMAVERAHLRAA